MGRLVGLPGEEVWNKIADLVTVNLAVCSPDMYIFGGRYQREDTTQNVIKSSDSNTTVVFILSEALSPAQVAFWQMCRNTSNICSSLLASLS